MVFLTQIVQLLSREPTHADHKQCVSKIFVIMYDPRGVCNPTTDGLPTSKYFSCIITSVSHGQRQ